MQKLIEKDERFGKLKVSNQAYRFINTERNININCSHISRVANDFGNSAGGFIWKFKNIA